ncbi:hypothetical protein QSJ19_17415 [Gordonia sp. ABSL11-1]|uniref:hypothetical protein n=1 Tax=Gordonia sp. ABSL11-1 TaxID=3053924 RepID=UPI002573568B|nr:hypothetical protein [Gordonia sp. ABSL11-1]MDL9947324.1 hypothetical protein [Gordonia sp. ABSL11-1]
MSVQRIEPDEAAAVAVSVLGLDADWVDITSKEALCAALRRAASFMCPASPRQLVDAVLGSLAPLRPGIERDDVATALNALIGSGDLLELLEADNNRRMVFLGPPSYVRKWPGHYLLLGIRPDAGILVDEDSLGAAVTSESHTRTVILDERFASEALTAAGLHRQTPEQWIRAPRPEAAATAIAAVRGRLSSVQRPGPITGLMVLDAATPVRYYKGRWREPLSSDQGIFVGTRPQAYGSPVWCLVEFADGVPQAALDFPLGTSVAPGWDEGRRLQAALDANRGTPQLFRAARPVSQPGADWIFDFFGPLPSWAERYLDLVGMPVTKSQGALFSYRVPDGAQQETRAFLSKMLWMRASEGV